MWSGNVAGSPVPPGMGPELADLLIPMLALPPKVISFHWALYLNSQGLTVDHSQVLKRTPDML